MKKTLLLSVVASTMIMAGGDIAPVEPAVVAPVAAVSAWDFSGQAVAYYQTHDSYGSESLFDTDSDKTVGNTGIQLRAMNANLFSGIGAGVEVNGLAELPFLVDHQNNGNNVQQHNWSGESGGWISQAYLTYGTGNTSFKVGRQELPKALSPFAYSEGWNVFKNTFDAALVVNTDLSNTTLVGAYVQSSNGIATNVRDFTSISYDGNEAKDGVFMLTAQNKSIADMTLTGSYYHANSMIAGTDVNILWGDANYNAGTFSVAAQGGQIMTDLAGVENTSGYGIKVGGNLGSVGLTAGYTNVDDGTVPVANLGTNVKSPLYSQMVLNQDFISQDASTFFAKAGMKVGGGKVGVAYCNVDVDTGNVKKSKGDYSELDLTYKTKVGNTTLFAAYVYSDYSVNDDTQSFVRLWGRYNF